MIKIAHVSDIHIRNFKYHDVYSAVFEQLYDKLRELKPDIIINTGDTAHTKLQLSPAYFDMTAKFFTNLAEIAVFDADVITPFWSKVNDGIDVVLPTVVEVTLLAT